MYKISLGKAALSAVMTGVLAMGLVAAKPEPAQAGKTGAAIIGGVIGALGTAAILNASRPRYRTYRTRRYYRRRYYRAPRRYYARPAAWSPAWYRYCSRKYRSFNPNTGYYVTYSGYRRFCR